MTRKITGYYRDKVISQMTGLSLTTLWRLRKEHKFPRKVSLSKNTGGTPKEDVEEWMQNPAGWSKEQGRVAA